MSAKKNPKLKIIKNVDPNLPKIRLVNDQEKADKMKRARVWSNQPVSPELKGIKKSLGVNLKILEPTIVESVSPIKLEKSDEFGPKTTKIVNSRFDIEDNTDSNFKKVISFMPDAKLVDSEIISGLDEEDTQNPLEKSQILENSDLCTPRRLSNESDNNNNDEQENNYPGALQTPSANHFRSQMMSSRKKTHNRSVSFKKNQFHNLIGKDELERSLSKVRATIRSGAK